MNKNKLTTRQKKKAKKQIVNYNSDNVQRKLCEYTIFFVCVYCRPNTISPQKKYRGTKQNTILNIVNGRAVGLQFVFECDTHVTCKLY